MKIVLGTSIFIMMLGFVKYPTHPMEGEIVSIRIDYFDSEHQKRSVLINDDVAISQLKEACGRQWNYLFPLNSNEGQPSYVLTISPKDGTPFELYVDQDEVGMARNKNSKIFLYLKAQFN